MVCNVRANTGQNHSTRLDRKFGLSRSKSSMEVGYPAPSCVAFRKPALIFRAICINLQSDGVTDQM
jgi:hypothetical protein